MPLVAVRSLAAMVAVLLFAAGVSSEPAAAAHPGANGLVAVAGGNGGIWTIDPQTGARHVLIRTPPYAEYLYYPAWSPSGTEILYAECERSGLCSPGIVAASDGSRLGTFADSSYSIWEPAWGPDGSSIAYVAFDPNTPPYTSTIRLFTRASGSDVALTPTRAHQSDASPTWSPDGALICFSRARKLGGRRSHLYLMNADGTAVRRLTRGSSPDWSSDGSQIAFADGDGIFVISAGGEGRRRITAGADPVWSPDGTRLAYSYRRSVWQIDLLSGRSSRLVRDAFSPSWQPL